MCARVCEITAPLWAYDEPGRPGEARRSAAVGEMGGVSAPLPPPPPRLPPAPQPLRSAGAWRSSGARAARPAVSTPTGTRDTCTGARRCAAARGS